jgi:hypothetical protein
MANEYIRPNKRLLRNKTIFLSASYPERQERNNLSHEVDMAIRSATRAIYANSGRLVMRYRPGVATLLAMVAADYAPTVKAEKTRYDDEKASIFEPPQIWMDRTYGDKARKDLNIMRKAGFIETNDSQEEWIESAYHFIKSIKPVAMLCIGGNDEMREEVDAFREAAPNGKIYAMVTTGGAAHDLAGEVTERKDSQIVPLDSRIRDRLMGNWREWAEQQKRKERLPKDLDWEPPFRFTPYSIIMQEMVEELVEKPRFFEA